MKGTADRRNTQVTRGLFSTLSDEWETPPEVFEPLDEEFHFTLDPCAATGNAKCALFFTKQQDGLVQDWGTHRVFCNPPYGRQTGVWLAKCVDAARRGALVVAFVPNRSDTRWWHEHVEGKAAEIRPLRGRVKFLVGGEARKACTFPSVFVVYRPGLEGSRRWPGSRRTGRWGPIG